MKIIVGLGNPGNRYRDTRHNVGFMLIDRLVAQWNARGPIEKHKAETFQAEVDGESVLLIKPMTYMNLSGESVAPPFQFFKLKPSDLIVAHDDLDLRPCSLKIKTGGGTGGHNGLKSIDACLGAGQTGYHRIRLGIGHPARLPIDTTPPEIFKRPPQDPATYVLEPFRRDELEALNTCLDRATQAVQLLLADQAKEAMNRFNR